MIERSADDGPGQDLPTRSNRRTIPATCSLHRGPTNFTNLVLSKASDGTIVLAPHAVGLCTIVLDEDGATAVRDALTEWLGG